MTVNANDTIERYAISGTGPYAFSLRIFAETDLSVTACSAETPPVPYDLTYLTHYTVSGANDADGGSITLTSDAATTYAGYTLDIRSNTPQQQGTSIRNLGRFLPEIHEDAFDNLSRQIQDLSRRVDASVHLPDNEMLSGEVEAAEVRKGRYLFWDSVTGAISSALSLTGTVLSQAIFNAFYFLTDDKKRTAAEIAAGVTPVNYAYPPGNIRRYGAVVDGATDDAAAVRLALDLAARDGTPVTCRPPGQIKIGSTVYIPQNVGGEHREMHLSFHGCQFIGQGKGTGTIFESGTGSVSTEGATNFGQADESSGSLHYALVIEGGLYTACGYAFRLFNCIYGTVLRDMRFEDLSRAVLAHRCFASRYYNLDAQIISITAGHVLFDFTGLTNAIVVQGCSAQGGGSNTTGIGYSFATGAGLVFQGNTAEGLDKGLVLGPVQGGVVEGNYFEGITTLAIDASTASNREMDIDNNWFLSCGAVITASNWIAGKFGAANHIQSSGNITINDVNSFCTVEIAGQAFTEAQATAAAVKVPASYVLSNSITLRAPRVAYAASSGLGSPIAIDSGTHRNVPAFAYSGGAVSNGASFTVPFCTQTLSSGSSVIDTQISWNTYHMHVYFGLYTEINGVKYLDGFVGWNGTVRRLDATANITVTASDNSGKLRLTITGSAHTGFTANGFWGQIRHV